MKKRKAHEHEEHIDETWLIPYADLLTLLLALFIVLFASSQIDQKKFEQLSRSLNVAFNGGDSFFLPSNTVPFDQSGLERNKNESKYETTEDTEPNEEEIMEKEIKPSKETDELMELKEQMDAYILDNDLNTQISTNLNQDALKISINSDDALFATASAIVEPEARQIALTISDLLSEYPGYDIIVSGHTDNVPIHNNLYEDNWDLSAERALNFMKILLSNENLDKSRFRSEGHGEYKPVASNETAAGRALNRRVEISILRNEPIADESKRF